MIETACLKVKVNGRTAEEIDAVFKAALQEAQLTIDDLRVGNEPLRGYGGQWQPINRKYAYQLAEILRPSGEETFVKYEDHILEPSDLERFKVGDRVTIELTGSLGYNFRDKGTISRFETDSLGRQWIIVRKYRSRTRGYRLMIGAFGGIWQGWGG